MHIHTDHRLQLPCQGWGQQRNCSWNKMENFLTRPQSMLLNWNNLEALTFPSVDPNGCMLIALIHHVCSWP